MASEIQQLNTKLSTVETEKERLSQKLADAQKKEETLRRIINQQRRQIEELLIKFSRKKGETTHPDQQLFDDLLLEVLKQSESVADEAAHQEESDADDKEKKPKRRKKHPGRNPLPTHLERHVITIDIPEDEKVDPITKTPLKVIRTERTEKLEVIPARLRVNVYERPVYALPKGQGIVIAELPLFPLDKCKADNGFLADIAVKRFVDHLPYYRQAASYDRDQLGLKRNQLDDWMLKLGDDILVGLYEALKSDVLSRDYVGFDDSGIKLQIKGLGKLHSARMWICRSGVDPPHVFFRFSLSKEKKEATALLEDFSGYAQADAYSGHNQVMSKSSITEVGCWAHAIRRFKAALEAHPLDTPEILTDIGKLYKIEEDIRTMTAQQRYEIRQQRSAPVVNDLFNQFKQVGQKVVPKSPLGEAVRYCLNQEKPLRAYLKDGRLRIDNNEVERGIRPLGIGRKNWLFAGSERGGRTAAVFLSLFGSCRNLSINPWLYLKDVLDRIMPHPKDRLRELLPGYWQPLKKNTTLGVPIYVSTQDSNQ